MILYIFNLLFYVTSAYSANILGVFLCPSVSHQIVYQPIWRELSVRGHQVTVITPNPLKDPTLTNLTEIDVSFGYNFTKDSKFQKMIAGESYSISVATEMFRFLTEINEAELNSAEVKELLADESKEFDLILVEWFHPSLYGFSGRFNAPIIGVTSMKVHNWIDDIIGNPAHPVLHPDYILNLKRNDLTLWQKTVSVLLRLLSHYYRRYILLPSEHKIAVTHFGDNIPYLGDLEKNQSMFFSSVNPSVYPRSTARKVVEIAQMHIKPVRPLPHNLKKILDEAEQGFVYVSFGTNVHMSGFKKTFMSTIMEALAELPYIVIVKSDSDYLPGKPKNVITKKWLPQQDLLAHPNIKVFVTQGGLQSIEEAISRRVPMVAIPFMADQPSNVQDLVDLGIALKVDYKSVTKQELKSSIVEVAQNSKFKKRLDEVGNILLDRPMTGLEKAIWSIEYVIRNKGAEHLKDKKVDMSWFEFLLLDVIFVTVFLIVLVILLSFKVIRIVKLLAYE